ncbi:hypothetical protein [uncultured Alsobacter sp.]|uniref:hypothetical protein n=1 Tax=uncultured Alsobacter sp. TaxID=1748258 RepID=UPI0025F2B039|nr:hypothetical protein [uncultured Alsobacter sp.]
MDESRPKMPEPASREPKAADTGSPRTLAIILLAISLVWAIWPMMIALGLRLWPRGDLEAMGQSGDMFGSLTALFTALAFGAVWWTGWLQRKALAIQAKELAAQQEELRDTRAVMARQLFDSRFFRMLDLLETRNQAIRVGDAMGQQAKRDLLAHVTAATQQHPDAALPAIMDAWSRHGEGNPAARSGIEAWLATLSVTLAVIDDPANGLGPQDRLSYAHILKASLDEADLVMVACNALMWGTLNPLAIRYGTLGNLYDETLRAGLRERFAGVVFDW